METENSLNLSDREGHICKVGDKFYYPETTSTRCACLCVGTVVGFNTITKGGKVRVHPQMTYTGRFGERCIENFDNTIKVNRC